MTKIDQSWDQLGQAKAGHYRGGPAGTFPAIEWLRLRGLSGARDEFHLAAIVQNLKTLALHLAWPPPDPATASVA